MLERCRRGEGDLLEEETHLDYLMSDGAEVQRGKSLHAGGPWLEWSGVSVCSTVTQVF